MTLGVPCCGFRWWYKLYHYPDLGWIDGGDSDGRAGFPILQFRFSNYREVTNAGSCCGMGGLAEVTRTGGTGVALVGGNSSRW